MCVCVCVCECVCVCVSVCVCECVCVCVCECVCVCVCVCGVRCDQRRCTESLIESVGDETDMGKPACRLAAAK